MVSHSFRRIRKISKVLVTHTCKILVKLNNKTRKHYTQQPRERQKKRPPSMFAFVIMLLQSVLQNPEKDGLATGIFDITELHALKLLHFFINVGLAYGYVTHLSFQTPGGCIPWCWP